MSPKCYEFKVINIRWYWWDNLDHFLEDLHKIQCLFLFAADLNLDEPHFICSIATCGCWLLYWPVVRCGLFQWKIPLSLTPHQCTHPTCHLGKIRYKCASKFHRKLLIVCPIMRGNKGLYSNITVAFLSLLSYREREAHFSPCLSSLNYMLDLILYIACLNNCVTPF